MTAVAALPIAAALILLAGLHWPARRAMPVCAVLTAAVALIGWQVPAVRVAAATMEAMLITLSILLILFGALLFLALLRSTGAITVLQAAFSTLSPDARIQAVLIGWILGSFLEGAAGFGTPAAITTPLLIGLGFPPLAAVVVALVGDSTAVSFGAVGTPMLIGMGEGLAQAGTGAPTVASIAAQVATLDLVLGTVMPAFVVMALVGSTRGLRQLPQSLGALPFALTIGLAQAITSWLVVVTLGPEFPSLAGPLGGLLAALLLLKTGWLMPKSVWRLNDEPPEGIPEPIRAASSAGPSTAAAFAPYGLLIVLLVISRNQALPVREWLSSAALRFTDILGTGIDANIAPLYSPGAIFIFCTGLSALWLARGSRTVLTAARSAGGVTLQTALALLAAIITVRIFIHSGVNAAGLAAMPLVLAATLAEFSGQWWPLIAPWVGALGSFIAGSATFSNMLFALLQLQVAEGLQLPPATILALQSIGAAAGNMVCIHNVVAACAVAGILGREGDVIRRTALPMLAYLLLAGALGMGALMIR